VAGMSPANSSRCSCLYRRGDGVPRDNAFILEKVDRLLRRR
jgi:hypothetical protein